MMVQLFSVPLFINLIARLALGESTDCSLALDIVLVQDTTASFVDDLGSVAEQIPTLFELLAARNSNSKVALVEFRDKPFRTMGEPTDYCRKFKSDFTDNPDVIAEQYRKMEASGGLDIPEAIYGAIIETIIDPNLSWRPLSSIPDPTGSTAGARVIIVSTDAYPHNPGDWKWYNSAPRLTTPYPDDPRPYDRDLLCTAYDYPSINQTVDWIERENINIAILTPTITADTDPRDIDTLQRVNRIWNDLNTNVFHNPPGMYQYISSDSSDAIEAIMTILADLTKYRCTTTTSTTSGPSSRKTRASTTPKKHRSTSTTTAASDDTTSDCIWPTGNPETTPCIPNCVPNCVPNCCGLLAGAPAPSGVGETMELKIRKQPKLLDIHYEGWDSSEASFLASDNSSTTEEDVDG